MKNAGINTISKNDEKATLKKHRKIDPKKYRKMLKKSTSKNDNFSIQKKHRKMTISGGPKNPDAPKTEKSIFSENVGKY